MSNQKAANLKLWDAVTRSLEASPTGGRAAGWGKGAPGHTSASVVKVKKMTLVDDPEAYLNTLEGPGSVGVGSDSLLDRASTASGRYFATC